MMELKPTFIFAISIIFVIILVWYSNIWTQTRNIHALLGGFWEADDGFCEEAGLDSFTICFDKDHVGGYRGCYILAIQDNNPILNIPAKAHINPHFFSWKSWCSSMDDHPRYYSITFDGVSEDDAEIFPKQQNFRYYPITGKLVLYKEDTITAVLYKNPVNTELQQKQHEKQHEKQNDKQNE